MSTPRSIMYEDAVNERKLVGKELKKISQVIAITNRQYPNFGKDTPNSEKKIPLEHEALKDNEYKTYSFEKLIEEKGKLEETAREISSIVFSLEAEYKASLPTGFEDNTEEQLIKIEEVSVLALRDAQDVVDRIREQLKRIRAVKSVSDKLSKMSPQERAALTHMISGVAPINSQESVESPG